MNKLSLQAFVAVYFRSNGSVFRSSHINCELRGLIRAWVRIFFNGLWTTGSYVLSRLNPTLTRLIREWKLNQVTVSRKFLLEYFLCNSENSNNTEFKLLYNNILNSTPSYQTNNKPCTKTRNPVNLKTSSKTLVST